MKCIIEISLDLATKLESHGSDPIKILENSVPAAPRKRETSTSKNAVSVLSSLLSKGPVLSQIVMERAVKAGVSRRALAHAKKDLKVVVVKNGFRGRWSWSMPDSEVRASYNSKKRAASIMLELYDGVDSVDMKDVYHNLAGHGIAADVVDAAVEFLNWSTRAEGGTIYLQTHNLC